MPVLSIAFVVFDGFQSMALAAQPVFAYANVEAGATVYERTVLSERGGILRSAAGLSVMTEAFDDRIFDTVIVSGVNSIKEETHSGVLEFIRSNARTARRTASICSGAFVLAQAGLLDGRRATTHGDSARDLMTRYPSIKVEDDRIFMVDGQIWTSAGMASGIDMALAMIELDLGLDIACRVAQKLLVYHRRSGGQSQRSALLELAPKSDRIQTALTYARQNLASPLSIEQLADAVCLSTRQFSRAFRAETGQSPGKAIENLRLEAARIMLEDSSHSLGQIAGQTGFINERRMRDAFLRAFGLPPQVIRRRARNETS